MKETSILFYISAALTIYTIGMIISSYMGYFGFDYMIYHASVSNFLVGLDPYIRQFYYLNYFNILVFWMFFLPYNYGFFLFLTITMAMYLIILKNLETAYDNWWFIGNALIIILAFITFNVDIWLVFSLFMYQKYHKKWFSPFFFLLAIFKGTFIIPALFLIMLNVYFEKKVYWKQIPAILIIFFIIIISMITSTGLYSNIASSKDSNLLFQVTHWMWWSFPFAILLKYKSISMRNLKIFWVSYFILEITYGLITTLINNYIPMFIQSF